MTNKVILMVFISIYIRLSLFLFLSLFCPNIHKALSRVCTSTCTWSSSTCMYIYILSVCLSKRNIVFPFSLLKWHKQHMVHTFFDLHPFLSYEYLSREKSKQPFPLSTYFKYIFHEQLKGILTNHILLLLLLIYL